MDKKLISIVTPCLNEEANVDKIYTAVKTLFSKKEHYSYEHIFIDNKSNDKTRELLREIAKKDKNVKLIFNTRNFGQWASPYWALQQSKGEAGILIVADLQDPPNLIEDFLRFWEEGYKTVIGIKKGSEGSKLSFFIRKFFYKLVNKFSDIDLYEGFMGFGLYDRKVIEIFKQFNTPEPYLRGIVADISLKVKKVHYTHEVRKSGKTKNDLYTLLDLASTAFTSYTKTPLRIISIFAFIFSIISFSIGIFYTMYKIIFWDNFTTGVAPIIILISVFFSFIFIFLGILAEYIGSINIKFRKAPIVIEEERINFEK